jgi:S1-C subfamily serine protease
MFFPENSSSPACFACASFPAIIQKLPAESINSESSSSATVIPSSDIYSKVNPSTVFVLIKWNDSNTYASGTGFFIDDSGDFVTNYHVIKNGIAGFIQKSDGTTGEIDEVLGASADLDIAILHAKVTSACSGLGNSDNVRVGDTVYAIGYPQAFRSWDVLKHLHLRHGVDEPFHRRKEFHTVHR